MMKDNYTNALEGFAKVRLDDFYYYIRIKYNKLRIYFELDEFESIFTEIDSFKHYLSVNESIPEDIRINASNYLIFFNRLIKARVNKNYDEVNLLKIELENSDMENKRTLVLIIGKILNQKNKI